ncbi:MAG: TOBE domain-containing protein [Clostridiales bacterium]|nr:TOBE domain-containing protein [Clostridiales bacterium]
MARFCGGEFACQTDFPVGTAITAVVRPEVVDLTDPEKGTIRGVVDDVIFKGEHYEVTIVSGRYEIVANTVHSIPEGTSVGITLDAEDYHIMEAEDTTNFFTADLNKDYKLEYNEHELDVSVTSIIKGSHRQQDGTLVDESGKEIDPKRRKVMIEIEPEDILMTDDDEEGIVYGHISDLVYKGDHYSYVVQTDLGQDFVVDDEELWNMGDYVGLIMPVDKMRFRLKK